MNKWKEKGYENERLNARMSRRIEKLNIKRTQLMEIKNSFDEVINSEVMFYYETKPNTRNYIQGGGTQYNVEKERVEIWVYEGLYSSLVHETRHGAGFIWKEWGWDRETNSPTNYDYQDEYEAFIQQINYEILIMRVVNEEYFQLKDYIRRYYSGNTKIIKEFKQYCEHE